MTHRTEYDAEAHAARAERAEAEATERADVAWKAREPRQQSVATLRVILEARRTALMASLGYARDMLTAGRLEDAIGWCRMIEMDATLLARGQAELADAMARENKKAEERAS